MSCSLPRWTNILTHLSYITFFLLVLELYRVHTSCTEVSASYLTALWYSQQVLMSFGCSCITSSCVFPPEAVTQDSLLSCRACNHHTHSFLAWFFFLTDAITLSQACVIKFCASKKRCSLRSESWSLKLWSCTAQVYSLACVVTRLKMMNSAEGIGTWSSLKESACLMVVNSSPSNKRD